VGYGLSLPSNLLQLQHFSPHKTTALVGYIVATREVFWAQNITEMPLRLGLGPGASWESLQRSPSTPSGFGGRFTAGKKGRT